MAAAEPIAESQSNRAGRFPVGLLLVWTAVEAAAFACLCLLGRERFTEAVSADDTGTYLEVAEGLLDGRFVASGRTLGYPLYLAACRLLDRSSHLAIALQLLINLAFALGVFRLVGRVVPEAGPRLRAAVASAFFVAGLGLALQLLTDFLAAACLFVAGYGLLFWRTRGRIILSSGSLGLATLLRPTFTFWPLLLPFLALWAGRFHQKVPRAQLGWLVGCSLVATALSVGYQYHSYRHLSPSSVVAFNVEATLYHALDERQPREEYHRRFQERIAARAGRSAQPPSRSDEERIAKQLFVDALRGHPTALAAHLALTAVKYLVAPIEGVPDLIARVGGFGGRYATVLRPLLFLVCLPIWVLAVLPPVGGGRREWAYYGFTILPLLYVVGLSAMAPAQGERMRFPLLAFLLPLAAARALEWQRAWRKGGARRASSVRAEGWD